MADLEITTVGDPTGGNGQRTVVLTDTAAGTDTSARSAAAGSDELDAMLAAGRRRRRWPWFVLGIAFGAGGVVAAGTLLDTDGADGDAALTESFDLTVATVETRDLVEEVEYSARLDDGASVDLVATVDGTVTESAPAGSPLGRGDQLASIDGEPVVVFIADAPYWRGLEEGDEGDDVLSLEANLAALGFDDDGQMTVDGDFTSSTADAVEEWEESLGLEPSGQVPLGRVVAIGGAGSVVEAPDVGSVARSGQPLAVVEVERSIADVVHIGTGEVTDVVAAGTTIASGDVLWRLDAEPVTAVVDADDATVDLLDAMAEDDTEVLEQALVDLGFDPDEAIAVDDEVDVATEVAMIAWQESIGIEPNALIGAEYYLPVDGVDGVVVEQVFLADGDTVEDSALAFSTGAPLLTASADIAADEIDGFAVGDPVTVELADETTLAGSVASIADVADEAATPDAPPTIEITVDLADEPGAGADDDLVTGPVTLIVEASRIDGATVVPTRALVSLREGGFAVEVRSPDGGTRLVGVELGTFDDGVVEVVEGDVRPGDEVVVPS